MVRIVNAAAATTPRLSSKLFREFRPHLRHVHFPDHPPLYAPRGMAMKLRDVLESLVAKQRVSSQGHASNGTSRDGEESDGDSKDLAEMEEWLRRAPPPPTVLSHTRRPTYIIPKHRAENQSHWETDFMSNSLKASLKVNFPEPPGWSSLPWRRGSQADTPEEDLPHHPLQHSWEPGVMIMPCAEAMFLGPGQLSLWPIMDLRDNVQLSKKIGTKYQLERLLEDTTIKVLEREYGIAAYAIPGRPGVWVDSHIPPTELFEDNIGTADDYVPVRGQNTRRIATVHADIVNDMSRYGVSIHVGSPAPSADASVASNPWSRLRQHNQTTSIAAELAYIGFTPISTEPGRALRQPSDRKSKYLSTLFTTERPFCPTGLPAMPYSSIAVRPGHKQAAPLGLDNRDLSTAWTYEFARQIMGENGFVDHFSIVPPGRGTWNNNSPLQKRRVGFLTNSVRDEHLRSEPYDEVGVPSIRLSEDKIPHAVNVATKRIEASDGRLELDRKNPLALSWPLYQEELVDTLQQSIGVGPLDTRWLTFRRKKDESQRAKSRQQALQQARELNKSYWSGPNALVRLPTEQAVVVGKSLMSMDTSIVKLIVNMMDMQRILSDIGLGSEFSKLLDDNMRQMRTILQSKIGPMSHGAEDEGGLRQSGQDVTYAVEVPGTEPASQLQNPAQIAGQTMEEARGKKGLYDATNRVAEEANQDTHSIQSPTPLPPDADPLTPAVPPLNGLAGSSRFWSMVSSGVLPTKEGETSWGRRTSYLYDFTPTRYPSPSKAAPAADTSSTDSPFYTESSGSPAKKRKKRKVTVFRGLKSLPAEGSEPAPASVVFSDALSAFAPRTQRVLKRVTPGEPVEAREASQRNVSPSPPRESGSGTGVGGLSSV